MRYRIEVTTSEQLKQALSLSNCDYVYAPIEILLSNAELTASQKEKVIIVQNVFAPNPEPLLRLKERGFTRALAHTSGHIEVISQAKMSIHGGFRLNITNSLALSEYERLGLTDAILSVELSFKRIKALKTDMPIGIIAYGKIPLMLLRRCPVSEIKPNGGACDNRDNSNPCGLTDRKNKFLPLYCRYGEVELLNPNPLILSDKDLPVNFAALKLFDENPQNVLSAYLNKEKPTGEFTRGLY